jgi:hypothetical protein
VPRKKVPSPKISEEEKELLDSRWKKFFANPDSALTLEQVKTLINAKMRRRA